MHGGANTLHPAMHGGTVGPPRGVGRQTAADMVDTWQRVPRYAEFFLFLAQI